MLNVPAEIQEVIKSDSALKNFRVHFPNGERADLTNENIVYESVSFNESVCSSNVFRFGVAEASTIEFETVGIENIVGMTIECSMEYAVPEDLQQTYGEWYSIPYGVFVVDSCPRDHRDITHRRVVGYSLLKYLSKKPNFLQKRILNVPSVHISYDVLYAYATNDASGLVKETRQMYASTGGSVNFLYDANGLPYGLRVWSPVTNVGGVKGFQFAQSLEAVGFSLEYEETGTLKNEEVGQMVVDYLDNTLNVELLYDANGKKIFETNKEAVEYWYGFLFRPVSEGTSMYNNYGAFYPYFNVPIGEFYPLIKEDALNSDTYTERISVLGDVNRIQILKYDNANVFSSSTGFSTVGTINIDGYSETETLNLYKAGASMFAGEVEINATLSVAPTLVYRRQVSNKLKDFYGTAFAYSNAYSNYDILSGIAELNCSFIHSERDGTISMESLDNSNPYQLMLSDVEDNAWWDEYDVSPIGSVDYTFLNPLTGRIASSTYTFDEEAKSNYDLSGNPIMEMLDFSVLKASTVASMTNKKAFYKYTGSETGYTKDDFYYYDGESWVSGGHYEDATSIANFVLKQLFIPHIRSVNFTPVEMNIRGLPFLEAGDAFTLALSDGTVLNSYILNHTIDGIQRMTDSIESVSGEVVE